MSTYGEVRRSKSRMRVIRGYPGNTADNLSHLAKPSDDTIRSGHLISLNVEGEWVRGLSSDDAIPYIAYHDSSANQTDVTASRKLLGYSLNGNYEIETAFFKAGEAYPHHTPLKAGEGADAGLLVPGTVGTDVIVGFTTRVGPNGDCVRDLGATNERSEAEDNKVLAFEAKWILKS